MRTQRRMVVPAQPVEVAREQYVEPRSRRMPYPAAPIVGAVAGASGVLVIISTFFSWISGSGVTGWSMMFKSGFGTSQNFLFSTGGSRIVFSGFCSLLFGILIVAGAVTLITGWGGANGLVLTAGILGLIISVLSIVMIYTVKLQSLTPGAGLWMFAVFSLIAAVAGGVGQSQMDYMAEG
jgi:hypothetical protein